jgi:hypothetical protein
VVLDGVSRSALLKTIRLNKERLYSVCQPETVKVWPSNLELLLDNNLSYAF